MTRNAMSRTPIYARHDPCALPYHAPGCRVRWQRWDSGLHRFVWARGVVVSHVDRTLVIEADLGVRVRISCGPVIAEVE